MPLPDIEIRPERDDWQITFRWDLNDGPTVHVWSEYIFRMPDGHRIVVQGIPEMAAAQAALDGVEVSLGDGQITTLGAVIAGLRSLAAEAINQFERDRAAVGPKDDRWHKPGDLRDLVVRARGSSLRIK